MPFPQNVNKIWVMKINAYGDTIWSKIIGRAGTDATSIVCTDDGGCVLTGRSGEAFTIRLDRNGNIVWERYYGVSGGQAYKIAKTSDGGYIACGRMDLQHAFVFKVDSSGQFQWSRTFLSGYTGILYDIVQFSEGNYLTCGYNSDSGQDTGKGMILGLGESGELLWQKRYKLNTLPTVFRSINKVENGLLIGGSNGNTVTSTRKCVIARTDSLGSLLSHHTLPSTSNEYFFDLDVIRENKYVISMSRDSADATVGKAVIIDSTGNVLNFKIFPTIGIIELRSAIVLSGNNILLTGNAEFGVPGQDEAGFAARTDSALHIKTSGVHYHQANVSGQTELFQIHESLSSPVVRIVFLPKLSGRYELKLYDISGRNISTLFSGYFANTRHEYKVNLQELGLSVGTYFAVLASGRDVEKAIKISYLK